MKRLILLLGTVGLLILAMPAAPAQAENHWPVIWNHPTVQVRLSSNTGWSDAQIGAVHAAIHAWNSQGNANTPTLDFDGGTHLVNWSGCTTGTDLLVERVGVGGIPGHPNADGWTDQGCNSNGHFTTVHLYFTQQSPADWTNNIPESPLSDYGEAGLLTHEFGHALGFYGHWQDDNSGYCTQGPNDSAGHWGTMCSGYYTPNGLAPFGQNYDLNLSQHDIDSFDNAYS